MTENYNWWQKIIIDDRKWSKFINNYDSRDWSTEWWHHHVWSWLTVEGSSPQKRRLCSVSFVHSTQHITSWPPLRLSANEATVLHQPVLSLVFAQATSLQILGFQLLWAIRCFIQRWKALIQFLQYAQTSNSLCVCGHTAKSHFPPALSADSPNYTFRRLGYTDQLEGWVCPEFSSVSRLGHSSGNIHMSDTLALRISSQVGPQQV